MTHPLDGSRARIERAGDHLEALDTTLARWAKYGSFRISGEHDPDTGEYVMRIYSQRQPPVPPPTIASVMVGDALNSLRSSLDYVVWQLAEAPSRKNQFPVCDSPELFKEKRERYLCSVPQKLWAKFEAYQPYPDRDDMRSLGILAKLNDADKHRLLLPAAMASASGRGKFTVSGLDSMTVKGRDWVPFEDGAEIYRMRLVPHSGSNVDVKADVPYTVLFADPESGVAITIGDLRMLVIGVSNVVESFAEDFPA